MKRRKRVCKACGRPFAPELPVNGPVRQRIVDIIAARPDGITRDELMALVYADRPDGGPNDPHTISVLINRANKDLRPQGFQIWPAWLGRGGRYRLIAANIINEETPCQKDATLPQSIEAK